MENLRTLRENANLTQRDFAKILDISKTTLCYYEQGKISPSVEMLVKIADYFDVSIDYLIGHQTQNIVHIDSYTENQQKAISLMKKLSDDEMLVLLGYLARITNTPLEEVTTKTKENK